MTLFGKRDFAGGIKLRISEIILVLGLALNPVIDGLITERQRKTSDRDTQRRGQRLELCNVKLRKPGATGNCKRQGRILPERLQCECGPRNCDIKLLVSKTVRK